MDALCATIHEKDTSPLVTGQYETFVLFVSVLFWRRYIDHSHFHRIVIVSQYYVYMSYFP
jgi:hypothetical protein